MTYNNEESFGFELDKTVYFKPHYEISELRKISLDPDILITPQDDYILINGLILLQGEYKKSEQERSSEEIREIEQSTDLVTEITDLRDGLTKFNHQFPIDITIPAHRVRNLSNVSVVIQSFDYELPRSNALEISSKIEINGINTTVNEDEQSELAEPVRESKQTIDGDLTKATEKIEQPDKSKLEGEIEESQSQIEQFEDVEVEQTKETTVDNVNANKEQKVTFEPRTSGVEEKVEVNEQQRLSEKNDQEVADKIEKPEKSEAEKSDIRVEPVDTEVDAEEEGITNERDLSDINSNAESEELEAGESETEEQEDDSEEPHADGDEERSIDIQVKESEEETDDEVKDVHFLTTIFNRANEESYSKLRIYIVQDGDTVHSIAKHYEVSSLRLLQLNNLTGEELEVGELLYIPEVIEAKNK